MIIQAIVWDFGGVLLRTDNPKPRQELAQSLGMSAAALEEVVYAGESGLQAQRGEISLEQHWENVSRILGLETSQLEAFKRQFWAGDILDEDLLDYIRSLKPSYRIGLLSNAFGNLRHYLTRILKIADLFDHITISAEVGITKPNPRIYHHALEGLGVSTEKAVFIDDFEHNIQAAQALGMHTVHFRSVQQARAELEELLGDSRP